MAIAVKLVPVEEEGPATDEETEPVTIVLPEVDAVFDVDGITIMTDDVLDNEAVVVGVLLELANPSRGSLSKDK